MYLSLSCDWLRSVQSVLFLAQGAAQLGQRNVLQLANTLARDAEILTNVFQRLRFSTIEAETLRDNFLLATIEQRDQAIHFTTQVLVAQPFKGRLRFFVSDHLAKLRRIIVPNRRVQRSGADAETP